MGVLFTILTMAFGGCDRAPPEDLLAQVGDAALTSRDLESRVPAHMAGRISGEERKRVVDAWVEEQLLYQETIRQNLDEDPGLQRQVEQATRDLLTAELLERTFSQAPALVDEEIQAYYETHREEFVRDQPTLRARHILVELRADVARLKDRLDRGELFDQVAREASIDESAVRGGDLGYFKQEQVDPSFWSACEGAKIGRTVQARTHLGHHLIEVLDRREAGVVYDLFEVRGEIRQRLLAERRQAATQVLLDSIKGRISVTIHEDRLKDDLAP